MLHEQWSAAKKNWTMPANSSRGALQQLRFRQQKSNELRIGKGNKLYQLELRHYIPDNPQLIFFWFFMILNYGFWTTLLSPVLHFYFKIKLKYLKSEIGLFEELSPLQKK